MAEEVDAPTVGRFLQLFTLSLSPILALAVIFAAVIAWAFIHYR